MKHSRQDQFELHACAACPLLIRVHPREFVVPQKTYKSCPAIPGAIFDPIVPRYFALYRESEICPEIRSFTRGN